MKKNKNGVGTTPPLGKLFRIMRITILLLVVFLVQVSASTYSQSVKLSLNMKNVTLADVFKEVEKKSEYRFFYDSKEIDATKKVSVKTRKSNVEQILDDIFQDANVTYQVIDRYIVVKRNHHISAQNSAQQQKRIKGKVTDENGESLPGVSIVIKGTTVGITTDIDGNYELLVTGKNPILQFSFVGMKTEEVAIAGKEIINVVLKADAIGLDEVIAVGYGTMKKTVVSGAVASVKSEEIQKVSTAHVSTALVGKVGGIVSRQNDGRPGRSTSMQIRGMGTPLYIIDGTPKDEGQFNNIDPNDIETISILKDASASIYGIKAANGVVIVETKKGKRNKPNEFNIHYTKTFQNWTRFAKSVNAGDYMELLVEDQMNRFGKTDITPEELAKWKAGKEDGYRSFDWYKFAVKEWAPQDHLNINTSGGSEKINYYVSFSHFNQDALFSEFNFNRSNIQSNIEALLAKNLTIGMQINGRIETKENPGLPWYDDYTFPLWCLLRNIPTQRPYANDNPNYVADNGYRTVYNFGYMNKKISGSLKDTWRVLHGNMNLKYKFPVKGLTGKILGSYYYAQNYSNNQENRYDAFTYDKATQTYNRTAGNDNPYKDRRVQYVEEKMFQANLHYNNKFGQHAVDAVFAFEANERNHPNFWIMTNPTSDFITLMASEEFKKLRDEYSESSEMGFASRVNYTYADKYTVELLGRYDGTYVYAPGKRWGFFPGASVAYRLSEENFFKESPVGNILSNFKIRASYGKTGQIAGIGAFDYLEGYNFNRGKQVIDVGKQPIIGIQSRGLPITSVSWVDAINKNIGFDFGFLKNKLNGSIDFFQRDREGLPASRNDVLIPVEVGFNLPKENLESDRTFGWDAEINYSETIGELKLDLAGTITYARSKNLSRYNPMYGSAFDKWHNGSENRYKNVGWGYKVIGQFKSEEEIADYPVDIDGKNNTTLMPGDLIYQDTNKDGIITGEDALPQTSTQYLPLLNYGISVGLKWKNFDLYALFNGFGMYRLGMVNEIAKPFYANGAPREYMTDRWRRKDPFDANSEWIPGKYPSTHYGGKGTNHRTSDFWVKDVNALRLRTIEIGYTIPKHILDHVNLKHVRLFVSGQNVLTFDNIKEIDPETSDWSGRQYPQAKTWSFGFKCNF
ncbi:SusC/RagA family TonB-linked outer membrane protein [Prolixibacteraceae bacterium JC049]|nr:SusC/RagA family TonB-linked outer membrane protein [Prolixibacteraceae bacterium JC049]